MSSSALKRLLAAVAVPALALFIVGFGIGTAAAHDVSGISANCDKVTVNFAGFPDAGVTVHIAAAIEGHGTLATDVLVHNDMSAQLNISSATSALAGATASVDVDVTWTLEGPQHVHDTFSVTCGTATTTTTQRPTTTTVAGVTSTSMPATTTTTVAGSGTASTTSTTVEGITTTTPTTSAANVSGETSSTGPQSAVLGETASNETGAITPTGTSSGSRGTLPFTGAGTLPLLAIGLAALAAGTAAMVRRRHLED
jgi:hypothetical protein